MNVFINNNTGSIIAVDFKNGFRNRLFDWLTVSEPHIKANIELNSSDDISVTPEEIRFSGDNGVFILESIKIDTV